MSNMLIQMGSDCDKVTPLAARLGVAKVDDAARGQLLIAGSDGISYDVFDLINAFLDKVEKAAK